MIYRCPNCQQSFERATSGLCPSCLESRWPGITKASTALSSPRYRAVLFLPSEKLAADGKKPTSDYQRFANSLPELEQWAKAVLERWPGARVVVWELEERMVLELPMPTTEETQR